MSKFYQIKFVAILCLSLFIALNIPSTVQAQNSRTLSQTEDVAIAFYKTGDITPDFEQWIKKTSPYRDTPAAKRPKVMEEQLTRLINKYDGYNGDADSLKLRALVELDPQEHVVVSEENDMVKDISHSLKIDFKYAPDIFYFPFEHADQTFTIMPFNLEEILNVTIDEDYYEFFSEVSQSNDKLYLHLSMKPREAVTDRPVEIDGTNQWILKTDIATAEIWKRDRLIWEYTAPWYIAPELKVLQDMYDFKPKNSDNLGSVKPFIINKE